MVSVGSKLSAATIALALVVTAGIYVKLSRYQRENLLSSKELAASAVTRLFADSCAAPVVFNDDPAINEALATLGRNEEIQAATVWSVDRTGHVKQKLGELSRNSKAIDAPTSLPSAVTLERHPDRVVLNSPVRDQNGQAVAVATITFSLARENAAIADVEHRTLLVSIGVAIGLTVVLMFMARLAIVRPLAKLVVAAKKFEEGGAGEVDVHTNDEIGRLASAFRSMGTAIRQREERINARNRDMRLVLDNVGQGFITLDVEGTMSDEHSKIVDEWFGVPEGAMRFWDYLSRVDPAKGQWFHLGWTSLREDILPLALSLDQLPRVVHKDEQTFELAYRPILRGEQLDKTIVVITDVTSRVERERAEQAQREMMSIFHHILSDRLALEEFFTEATTLVDAVITSNGTDHGLITRHVHTLKGNCALFGIESVSAFCHALEDRMKESSEPIGYKEKEALRSLWAKVLDVRALLARGDSFIELDREEYDNFQEALRGHADPMLLAATVASWKFEPAAKRMGLIGEQVQRLATRLGRAKVTVASESTLLRLPPRKWGSFWSVFAHVIRNAVDHGIETTSERLRAGKPEQATVTLGVAREGQHVVVSIRDDGRGIDWERIAAVAQERGLPHETRADLEEALFADGVTSRAEVTDVSGRGVGLGAVRALVRQLGGRIEVESQTGKGTMFRFVMPPVMLTDDGGPRRQGSLPDASRWAPGSDRKPAGPVRVAG
ncbi:MAG TPA: ATP-binding protein [Polyangiaceae bacterium]|nr:ATP-binding protein [Polyangiaceae bacterium]